MIVQIVCLSAMVVCTLAQRRGYAPVPVQPGQVIPIVSYVNENNYDGSYRYRYNTL